MTESPWWPRREIGGYELVSPLSAGGMGQIYLARRQRSHGFEKLVAVKVIHDGHGASEPAKAMFLDEARLVAQLDHPGIAQVYDFGDDDGTLYLVMEYVEGLTFRRLLGHAPPPGVVALAIQEVCRALHAAHELSDRNGRRLGVVHRDVSPENLMLTFAGKTKVLDFGIALRRGRLAPDTQVGEIRGKPSYMAPEQVGQGAIDRRVDIFAVGLVFYELLTGQPVQGQHSAAAAASQPSLEQHLGDAESMPAQLAAVINRALAMHPDERFQSCQQMADAIGETLASLQGESLERYAERALYEERERANRWLRARLEHGAYPPAPRGRPTNVATLAAEPGASDLPRAVEPPADPSSEWSTQRPTPRSTQWPSRSLQPSWVARVVLLATVGLGLGWLFTSQLASRLAAEPPSAEDKTQTPVQGIPTVPQQDLNPGTDQPRVFPPAKPPPPEKQPPRTTGRAKANPSTPKPRKSKSRRPINTPANASSASVAPVGFGDITVGAEPYAIVWIDGQQVGPTPLLRHRLPTGRHTIRFVNPDDGQTRETRVVAVAQGGHYKIVAR